MLIVKPKEITPNNNYKNIDEENQRLIVPAKSERDYSIISGNSPIKKFAKKMTEIKLLDIRSEE